MMLAIASIRMDGGTQAREKIDFDHVERCREAYSAGIELPKVIVFFDGTQYWLADGHHRLFAAKAAQLKKVDVDNRPGSLSEAKLFASGANRVHTGLPMSNADKRHAVLLCLSEEVGRAKSDRWIAEHVGVGHQLVATVRRQVGESSKSRTARAGRDGKPYPATRKPVAPTPAADPEPKPEPGADSAPPLPRPAPSPQPKPDRDSVTWGDLRSDWKRLARYLVADVSREDFQRIAAIHASALPADADRTAASL